MNRIAVTTAFRLALCLGNVQQILYQVAHKGVNTAKIQNVDSGSEALPE